MVEESSSLQLSALIGFSGNVRHALFAHPDRHHLVYPLGFQVVIEDIESSHQDFLSGHTNNISCVDVSKCGKYVASGQTTFVGFKAEVIVWDYELRTPYCTFKQHRGSVSAVAFTYNSKYLITLGGIDDSNVIAWNISSMEPICGFNSQSKKAGPAHCLVTFNLTDTQFITAGEDNLRIWSFQPERRKLQPTDLRARNVLRSITSVVIDHDDKFFYCGTTTGDVMMFSVGRLQFLGCGPTKGLFNCGIISMTMNTASQLIIGAGDGTVGFMNSDLKKLKGKRFQVEGGVTSVTLRGEGSQLFVGTTLGSRYSLLDLQKQDLQGTLFKTGHYASVNDIAFPFGCSELLVTCSTQDIRVWHVQTRQEMLRITVPNMICNAVDVMRDGKSIISGWSDCKIRAYYPETGKLMYAADCAYGSMVTALAAYSNCRHFISGSDFGHLVIWDVPLPRRTKDVNYATRHELMMYNHGRITAIKISKDDRQCVLSCHDGSCNIWDLCERRQLVVLRADSMFSGVCYHPDEFQVVACGSDRKIGCWETLDGHLVRETEGSLTGPINAIDVSSDGKHFVTGGEDRLVKVWLYDEGIVTHMGIGHSSSITALTISPDGSFIVSVGSDGAIFFWDFPRLSGDQEPPSDDVELSKCD